MQTAGYNGARTVHIIKVCTLYPFLNVQNKSRKLPFFLKLLKISLNDNYNKTGAVLKNLKY